MHMHKSPLTLEYTEVNINNNKVAINTPKHTQTLTDLEIHTVHTDSHTVLRLEHSQTLGIFRSQMEGRRKELL